MQVITLGGHNRDDHPCLAASDSKALSIDLLLALVWVRPPATFHELPKARDHRWHVDMEGRQHSNVGLNQYQSKSYW